MKQRWSNWSGGQRAYPDFLQPKSLDELKKSSSITTKCEWLGQGTLLVLWQNQRCND